MKKLVLAVLLSSLFSLPAHALFVTTQQLFEYLSSLHPGVRGQAEWYIIGVADVAEAGEHVCVPHGVHSSQLARLIESELRDWPEIRRLRSNAGPFVVRQLAGHFPCQK